MSKLEEKINSGKKVLGEKINCSLEVLTPLHIGSGLKLQKGFDFLSENNYTLIFSKEEIENLLLNNPELVDQFENPDFKPADYLKKISNYRKYSLKCIANDILEFERNGDGIPYVPGSSLKGAIRTVLLYSFINSKTPEEQKQLFEKIDYNKIKFASETILKELFGIDSNHNLFRALNISDVSFDNNNLEMMCTYVLSLSSENDYKWKKMGRNVQNSDTISQATPIYSEMIGIGAKSNFNLRFDDFLLKNSKANEELKFLKISASDLSNKINEYSKEKIESEIKFISDLNSNRKLDKLLDHLNNLLKSIPSENSSEFILRMSWGSGWKGMTGDFLIQETFEKVRSKFRLGKPGFPIFPKSRKIVFEGQVPSYYTGWVRVILNHSFSESEISESQKINESKSITADKYPGASNIKNSEIHNPVEKNITKKDYTKAVIIDSKSKPPKIRITEGKFLNKETILPGVNLANLDLKEGSEVEVELSFDKKRNIQKADYKGKISSNPGK